MRNSCLYWRISLIKCNRYRVLAWQEAPIMVRRAHMKALSLAAVAVALTAVANLSLASTAGASVFGGNPWPGALQTLGARAADTTNRTPHYEWQYRYVGHHPRYEGHWVLVR
jgi:hypothetical protein